MQVWHLRHAAYLSLKCVRFYALMCGSSLDALPTTVHIAVGLPHIHSQVAEEITGLLNLFHQIISLFYKAPYSPQGFTVEGTPTVKSGCEQFSKMHMFTFVSLLIKRDIKDHWVCSNNLHKV